MRSLPNYNFAKLTSYDLGLAEVECQLRLLRDIIGECPYPFNDEDRDQLVSNIRWLKRFYELVERSILYGNGP